VCLLARTKNPQNPTWTNITRVSVREWEGKKEEEELTGDVELQRLWGIHITELRSCTAVAHCQVFAAVRLSDRCDLPLGCHWMGRFG
jgi:hypothetical protein